MKVGYLVNQYPKVSHSFIRREILALERQGFEVQRIALRGWDAELVDAEDVSERAGDERRRQRQQHDHRSQQPPAEPVHRRRGSGATGEQLRVPSDVES